MQKAQKGIKVGEISTIESTEDRNRKKERKN